MGKEYFLLVGERISLASDRTLLPATTYWQACAGSNKENGTADHAEHAD